MQFSSLKIKKFLIFGEMEHHKKPSEISEGNVPSLIKKKTKKKNTLKFFLFFEKRKFLAASLRRIVMFQKGTFST